jgi:hypothetical protein
MISFNELKEIKSHDPMLVGNNLTYFSLGYYPKDELNKILPKALSIPSDEIMAKEYPTAKKVDGMHPFLLMFSRCFNVHDRATEWELRPYLELIFYFPVTYKHKDEEQLCSYLPVLYLDFLIGVIGGLYLSLRKEFHPKMTYEGTDTSGSYLSKGIIDASFTQTSTENKDELDPFFAQIFKKPTLTISYLNQTRFYKALLYPTKVVDASAAYEWNYKGSVIKNDENTFANYCEYSFSTSRSMSYKKYFNPTYPVD